MAQASKAIGLASVWVLQRAVVAIVAAMALGLPSSSTAGVVAVVAGIDDYEHVAKLGGAVSDAEDLAASLARLEVRTALLLDRDATRANLLTALDDALAAAAPDDVIVFTFAGHGMQVPDQDGDEADGFDEAFVLPAFRPSEHDLQNLILDNEIDRLVHRAAPRTMIFLADSCHSGTMLRGIDARARFQRTRFVPRTSFGRTREATQAARPSASTPPAPAPDNLVFFGAVPEHLGVQEVLIEGRPRGALSYGFARGIEGLADRNGDAILTSDELMVQVSEIVRVVSENRQTPRTVAGSRSLVPLFLLPPGTPATAPTTAAASSVASGQDATAAPVEPSLMPDADTGFLRVAVNGSSWGASALTLNQLQGVEVVASPEAADLILHEPSGDVLTNQGDVAARLGEVREPRLLQGIVDKWRLLRAIESEVDGSLQARVLPGDNVFRAGDRFAIRITAQGAGHLVLFDLSSDGSLLTLYPRPNEPAPWLAAGEVRDVKPNLNSGVRTGWQRSVVSH